MTVKLISYYSIYFFRVQKLVFILKLWWTSWHIKFQYFEYNLLYWNAFEYDKDLLLISILSNYFQFACQTSLKLSFRKLNFFSVFGFAYSDKSKLFQKIIYKTTFARCILNVMKVNKDMSLCYGCLNDVFEIPFVLF